MMMRFPQYTARVVASAVAAVLLTSALASAARPREKPGDDAGSPDPAVQAMSVAIRNPVFAGKLGNVRQFGLDPNDPDLAKKLVPIRQKLEQQRRPVSDGPLLSGRWTLLGGQGSASGGAGRFTAGSAAAPLLINSVVPAGTAQAGRGDVLSLTGRNLAPGGVVPAIAINLGTCGTHALSSAGVNQNADGTQTVFVVLPDANPILADKLVSPAVITVGSTVFQVGYKAPIATTSIGLQVRGQDAWHPSSGAGPGTKLWDPVAHTYTPLGFREGVNAFTQSGGPYREQSIGLGDSGDDQLGVGVQLLHGFTVTGVHAVPLSTSSAAYARVSQAPGAGSTTLDTTVHWGFGITFFETVVADYALQWDVAGPLGARPIDTLPSNGACDVKTP